MTNYLIDLKAYATSYVTFGDGAKGRIKGIGKLARTGSPLLDDVLLVEGLTANMISISQLCDQGQECKNKFGSAYISLSFDDNKYFIE